MTFAMAQQTRSQVCIAILHRSLALPRTDWRFCALDIFAIYYSHDTEFKEAFSLFVSLLYCSYSRLWCHKSDICSPFSLPLYSWCLTDALFSSSPVAFAGALYRTRVGQLSHIGTQSAVREQRLTVLLRPQMETEPSPQRNSAQSCAR